MKYLLLIAGLYFYYRYRQMQRQRQVQGNSQPPIEHQQQNSQNTEDDSEYIDYEEID